MLRTEDIWLISPPMRDGAGAWGGRGAIRLLLLAWGSGSSPRNTIIVTIHIRLESVVQLFELLVALMEISKKSILAWTSPI
jgi:hypothetical protein